MKILYELSWLWETLGIALVAAAVCMACAALICKAAKKKLSKKLLAVIGTAAFVGAILAVILIARTPMPLAALIGRNVQSDESNSVWRQWAL